MIYNGFEPWTRPSPSARSRGPTIFCMASRGVALKGWSKAIEAFERLSPGAAELWLVGGSDYLDALRERTGSPHVRFLGMSTNPVDWIAQADVGLLPSEFPHESLPTAVMEYLYCAKPVIATDVGEIATMMRTPDGQRAGTLLSFHDERVSVEELSAAMQAYVDDPALRANHADLAQAAFAKFDMAACSNAYSALYERVVSSSSIKASH